MLQDASCESRRKSSYLRRDRRGVLFPPNPRFGLQECFIAATIALLLVDIGRAQSAGTDANDTLAPAAESAVHHVLRANSPIQLLVEETLVSGVNAPGTSFRMQVAEDIRVDDVVVIPAGTAAFGEIIDSKKAGMLGKAGVLVMSARFIHLGQRDIRLHSALGAAGESNIFGAFFVPFVYGKNATVEQGTRLVVRTAGDESF
jgi:hypothetical protein